MTATADDTPTLLTVAEVAAHFRVSKMTIYRQIEARQLPAIRVGRSFRIPADAVNRLTADLEWQRTQDGGAR